MHEIFAVQHVKPEFQGKMEAAARQYVPPFIALALTAMSARKCIRKNIDVVVGMMFVMRK